MKKINHTQLSQLIEMLYNCPDKTGRKTPLLVTGTFGEGKSAVIQDTAKEIAKKNGRTYLNWNEISYEEKLKIINDNLFKNYFILFDIRLSSYDATDLRGLPNFNKKWVEWKYPFFVEILQHPESDGIILFDEWNLTTPLVLSSCYQIFHDKVISDIKINFNWLIIGCGNKADDYANIIEIPAPLKDRCAEVELTPPTPGNWIKWASKNGIHPKIIAYLSWKGTMLRKVNFESSEKFTTERGWQRLSSYMHLPLEDIKLVAGTVIGEGVASEFMGFLEIENIINLEDIIKKPELLKTITEPGQKYFVISGLAEKYGNGFMDIQQLFAVSTVLYENKSADFVAMLWKMAARIDKTKFRKDFISKEIANHPLKNIFYKFLAD
jgi:hypothetical protein